MKFVVAFSSPKRSAKTVDTAARHARALGAEIVLFRVVPDPEKVGVVAQLISTDRPLDKAKSQVDEVVARLKSSGLNASGVVRIGQVAKSIAEFVREENADILFVGTTDVMKRGGNNFFFKRDPVVHYLVDNCATELCLVRTPELFATMDDADDIAGEPAAPPPGVAE
ncbi:MAG: universal stress protein [Candidatus Melainabacteria bacterium]|nr:universal stress protein [Candidatus Melainabacteria bacterium]